jgi:hypothetical protein
LSDHNQQAGRKLNAYCAGDRILDGDAFYIQIVDRGYCDGLPIPLPGGGTGGDDTIPVINAQPVTLEGNTIGGYSGPIPGVTATDADGDPVTLTNNAPATLPLGVTTVAWVARDPAGNRTTAVQTVTVVDTTGPSVTCPPATYRTLHPTLDLPSVHDAVDPNPTVTNNAPALFHLGQTTVTWKATDHSGNSTTCDQTVKIIYAPPLAGGQSHSLAVNATGTVLGDALALRVRPGIRLGRDLPAQPVNVPGGHAGAAVLGLQDPVAIEVALEDRAGIRGAELADGVVAAVPGVDVTNRGIRQL